jgi:thiol-disulfide isomerase/thioredoxin
MVKPHHRKTQKHHAHAHKKVLLGLVYADWCGHCQSLKPEWAKMKDEIKKNPKMYNQCEVMEFESNSYPKKKDELKKLVKNDEKDLDVSGYPTIFSIDKTRRHHKKYEGGRKAEDLLKWAKGENDGKVTEAKPETMSFFGGKKRRRTVRKTKKMCGWLW